MKKISLFIYLLVFAVVLVGCGLFSDDIENTTTLTTSETTIDESELSIAQRAAILIEEVDWSEADYRDYLNDDNVVVLDDSSESYVINTEGTYVLEGTITETVTISVSEDEDVNLILNNVTIISSENAAIVVESADETTITVLENTVNTLIDSETYTVDGEDYDAVIYAKTDLIINGTGTLNIVSNYNDGIICKDDLMIVDVTLDIYSVDDGINGKDSLTIQNVTLTLDVAGDGLKSTQDNDDDKGYIYLVGGTYTIVAGRDGIDAYNYVIISDGEFTITAEDKGITADTYIYICGGTFTIDALDDDIDYKCESDTEGGTFIESNE